MKNMFFKASMMVASIPADFLSLTAFVIFNFNYDLQ